MVTLPTVQPANVFGSYIGGQQARQQSDMNQMRLDAAQKAKAKEELTALAGIAMKADGNPEVYEQQKQRLMQMGILEEDAAQIGLEDANGLLGAVLGPQGLWDQQAYAEKMALGGYNAETARMNAETSRGRLSLDMNKPDPRRIIKGSDGRSYYEDTGEPVLPNDPGKTPTDPLAELKARAEAAGLAPGTPEYKEFMLKNGRADGIRFESGPNGEMFFSMGDAEGPTFGKAATNTLEGGVVSDADLFQRAAALTKTYDPEFLTYRNQGEAWLTKQAEKLGVSVDDARKQMLKDRTKFIQGVEGMFNAYRKEITGAAAAVQELERLKKAFINMDMSPSEFEAGLEFFLDESRRALRLKRKLLREGVSGADIGGMLDDLFLGGADDNWKDRAAELRQNDMTPEQAIEQIKAEGYQI
tara:strand:- start:327 stop:1568 length:1242 start_codon:yes stop_codon:yes gene_type:complete